MLTGKYALAYVLKLYLYVCACQRIYNHLIELNLILSVQKPMRNKCESNRKKNTKQNEFM